VVVSPWSPGVAIGVLGGTFDPVHLGHLAVAEDAREALGLAGVLFVPAGAPPHKPGAGVSPARHRLAMVELAIADNPWFRVSRLEVDREGPSYAVDTVTEVARESAAQGRDEPVFILSVEALLDLPAWREPARIVDRCRIAVVPRPGARAPGSAWVAEHFPGREDRFRFLDRPCLGHSASDVRARVEAGLSIRYLVPAEVEAYIREHRLYARET
jgi:nicotinate-nucleotide adenylyltransferase